MATIKRIDFGEHFRAPVGWSWHNRKSTFASGSHPTMDDKTVLMGAGDATTRLSVATNADKRFFNFYTESTATSGDSRGIYWQHFLGGAGATGDCARFFAKVNATGVAGAFGNHSTVQIQDDATTGITGLAAGARATFAAESDTRSLTGTLCALQVDSDIGANNTLPASNAFIRVADNGSVSMDNLFDIPATGCISGNNIKMRVAGAASTIPFYTAGSQDAGVLLQGTGTSASPETTAVADKAFFKFYTESTATSGDSRGIYWQHFLSGNGATGDCFRSFCKVNAATVAGGFGLHSTVQIQTGSGVTGLAAGARATLAAQSESRTLTGTLCALQVDSDIGASNTVPGVTAFIRVADNNSVTIPNFVHFAAGTAVANTTETVATQAGSITVDVGGTTKYIPLYNASS